MDIWCDWPRLSKKDIATTPLGVGGVVAETLSSVINTTWLFFVLRRTPHHIMAGFRANNFRDMNRSRCNRVKFRTGRKYNGKLSIPWFFWMLLALFFYPNRARNYPAYIVETETSRAKYQWLQYCKHNSFPPELRTYRLFYCFEKVEKLIPITNGCSHGCVK